MRSNENKQKFYILPFPKMESNESSMTSIFYVAGISLVIVIVYVLIYYAARGNPPGARVIQETAVNSDGIEPNQAKFMFFYTTWCPHCRSAQAPWKGFKEMLKNKHYTYGGKQIVFEDINAESDKGKAALYKIEAYPTFKVETTDKMYQMVGAPSSATFRAFLINALGQEQIVE